VKGILLDIEGTTTPISFVYNVLFPFARRRLHTWPAAELISRFNSDFSKDMAAGLQPPPLQTDPALYVEWLMDQDRKSTALKTLQGEIWQKGFESGLLRGEVFDDVPDTLAVWRREGFDVRIYSSGSVVAQRLLFSTTPYGDLTRFLNGFFDTTTGAKTDPASYAAIARAFGVPPAVITFVSDALVELRAAERAGFAVACSVRPGNAPQPEHDYPVITTLTQLFT
jgi:enolase-phosphatase E1